MNNEKKILLSLLLIIFILPAIIISSKNENKKEFIVENAKNIFYKENKYFANYVYKYGKEFEIEPSLIFSIIKIESGFIINAKNINNNGSIDRGLMQLNSYSFKFTEKEFFNIENNIKNGTKYLKFCFDKSNNNIIKALAYYNAGVEGAKKGISNKTLNYICNVLEQKEKFKYLD